MMLRIGDDEWINTCKIKNVILATDWYHPWDREVRCYHIYCTFKQRYYVLQTKEYFWDVELYLALTSPGATNEEKEKARKQYREIKPKWVNWMEHNEEIAREQRGVACTA